MKKKLEIKEWNRREHFEFFKQFDNPYYGVTVQVDCSIAYVKAKALGIPFYTYYLHKCLIAVNSVENMRYRIEEGEVWVYDYVDASATILREDKTFGFSHMRFEADLISFNQVVKMEIERVKNITGLFTTARIPNVVHFSALPWVDFSSISQASHSKFADSCPKLSIGKLVDTDGKKTMSIALHVHHALVDGYHVGQFYEELQRLMNEAQ